VIRSPTFRLSVGLVLVTVSILLTASLFGLTPDPTREVLDARKKLVETLAVQFSELAQDNNVRAIRNALRALEERNEDVLSAALRTRERGVVAEAGPHQRHWVDPPGNRSTATHALVPIFDGDKRWGTVEVSFTPVEPGGFMSLATHPLALLLSYTATAGFLGYLVFMRRALRELDPSSVIPPRVKSALDSLTEGVVLLDGREQIVLANAAFARKLERSPESLLGCKVSQLDWRTADTGRPVGEPPWIRGMRSGEQWTGVSLALHTRPGEVRTFVVNGAPILDGRGRARGALATFDDVTELQEKNTRLREALSLLETSQEEVRRQNEQLQKLAMYDPLTNCLNRRSFMQKLEVALDSARRGYQPIACIMVDIDHFKSINDGHGHAAGDQVIKRVAEHLRSVAREDDLVCRFGGEEFCTVLPHTDAAQAAALAERLRRRIAGHADWGFELEPGRHITASLGVASSESAGYQGHELLECADKALYVSKNGGRNRVTRWDRIETRDAALG